MLNVNRSLGTSTDAKANVGRSVINLHDLESGAEFDMGDFLGVTGPFLFGIFAIVIVCLIARGSPGCGGRSGQKRL